MIIYKANDLRKQVEILDNSHEQLSTFFKFFEGHEFAKESMWVLNELCKLRNNVYELYENQKS